MNSGIGSAFLEKRENQSHYNPYQIEHQGDDQSVAYLGKHLIERGFVVDDAADVYQHRKCKAD
jgi:hypothetical protein